MATARNGRAHLFPLVHPAFPRPTFNLRGTVAATEELHARDCPVDIINHQSRNVARSWRSRRFWRFNAMVAALHGHECQSGNQNPHRD
jgi:hypothetical protein